VDGSILFVESNTTGSGMLALDRARTLGLEPVLYTNDPRRYRGLEGRHCRVVVCDTNSPPQLERAVAADPGLRPGRLRGITTTSEFYLATVAELAASRGLPGNPPAAVATCRHKAEARRCLERAGVRGPRFGIAHGPDEAAAAVERAGLPCVVKPVDDTGSYGVRLCRTIQEVRTRVAAVRAMDRNVRGQETARTALVEEFIAGPEYSVEMFHWDGRAHCIGITEKHLTAFPHFVEAGHVFPAPLRPQAAAVIEGTVRRALKAVGFRCGPSHTEVKLHRRGCAVLEINARLAGGMIPELIRLAMGVDLLDQQLRAAVGLEPDLKPSRRRWAAIRFITAAVAGDLKGVAGVEEARLLDGVAEVVVTRDPGAHVRPPRSAYDRLGWVITAGDTGPEARDRLEEAFARLKVVVSPRQDDRPPANGEQGRRDR